MFLLSIVIPTRNRQKYAIETIKQIESVTDDRVEIVITDNSDENSLERDVKKLCSNRIKYKFIEDRISGVDNYANGISLCEGKYVCCIGDDDGVLRNIIEVVEWMKNNNVTALKPGIQSTYIWPGATKDNANGRLGLNGVSEKVFIVDAREELKNFLKTGCVDFASAKLVKAYHGIVRKDQFEKIYVKTGKYCGGLSPDIYLGVALSLEIDQLICIDIPLTIFGACKESTTADSLNKINTGKLEQAPHFIGQPYEWSSLIPRYYCGSNIWADSAMHALVDMKAEEYLGLFALDKFTSYTLLRHKEFKREIMQNYELNKGDKALLRQQLQKDFMPFYWENFKAVMRRNPKFINLYRYIKGKVLKNIGSEAFVKNGVNNISEAEFLTNKAISKYIDHLMFNLNQLEKIHDKS